MDSLGYMPSCACGYHHLTLVLVIPCLGSLSWLVRGLWVEWSLPTSLMTKLVTSIRSVCVITCLRDHRSRFECRQYMSVGMALILKFPLYWYLYPTRGPFLTRALVCGWGLLSRLALQ